jgi:hypothetical protein
MKLGGSLASCRSTKIEKKLLQKLDINKNNNNNEDFLRPHTLGCPGRATGATSTTCQLKPSSRVHMATFI